VIKKLYAKLVLLAAPFTLSSCVSSINSIDAPERWLPEISAQQAGVLGKKLEASAAELAGSGYKLVKVRYFFVDPIEGWNSVSKSVENTLRDKSVRFKEVVRAPLGVGIDSVDLYKLHDGAFAVAMAFDKTPDGKRLVAYINFQ
jgi:hypothetical protein